MNKRFIFLTFSILAIIFIAAILIFKPKNVPGIRTENKTHYEKYFLTSDTTRGAILIDISVEFPVQFKDNQILEGISLQVSEKLFGSFALLNSGDSILEYYVKQLKKEYISNNLDFAKNLTPENKISFNNTFVMEGFSLLNDENIFTYGIAREIDLGGSFPAKTRYFYNYSLLTGKQITEQDIFSTGYNDELTGIIQSKLKEELSNTDDQPESGDIDMSSIKPNGNFYINDEGICYVFNPYELSPAFFMEEIEVRLSYDSIRELLRTDSPVNYLAKTNNPK